MGWQHFGVGVNIYTGACRLLQQHFQIAQVVAGNEDSGIASYTQLNCGDFRIAVGRSVGRIQQCHDFDPIAACCQHQIGQVGCRQAVIQCLSQGLL